MIFPGRAERSDVLVEIPVQYNGEDLADVAELLGISQEEVVRRHTGSEYTVALPGFAPGFGYLVGGDPIFNLPRRSSPRTRVPAGSVALAGTFSAVYPQASPGGWQLIGVTDTPMWDLARIARVAATRLSRAICGCLEAGFGGLRSHRCINHIASAHCTRLRQRHRIEGARDGTAHRVSGHRSPRPGRTRRWPPARWTRSHSRPATAWSATPAIWPLETVGGGLQLQSKGDTVIAVTGANAPITVTTAQGQRWPIAPSPAHFFTMARAAAR